MEQHLKKDEQTVKKFGYTPEEYKKFKVYAWRFLLGFSFLYMCIYCCRLNLASAMPLMMEDEGWDTAQMGLVTGTLFWTYGLGHLVNGRLGEIFGSNRFVILSVILTCAANIILGFQNSLIIIAILWGFNGYFQSMAWSPGMSAIIKWWPGDTRGFATGLAHAFSGAGQALCILAVTLAFALMPDQGWRAAFWIPCAFPLIMLVIYIFVAKTSPTRIGLKEYEEDNPLKKEQEEAMQKIKEAHGPLYPYIHLLKNWKFIIWLVVAFMTGLARYGIVTWIPLYFIENFNVDIKSGLMSSLVVPLGMAIGTLVVPWLTDRFCPNNRLPAVIFSGLVAAIIVWVFFCIQPGLLAEVLLFFAGFFVYAINGLCWAYAGDVGGRVFAGTAAGMLDFSAYMGAGCQAAVFGFILLGGGWTTIFITISGGLLILVVLALVASRGKNKEKI